MLQAAFLTNLRHTLKNLLHRNKNLTRWRISKAIIELRMKRLPEWRNLRSHKKNCSGLQKRGLLSPAPGYVPNFQIGFSLSSQDIAEAIGKHSPSTAIFDPKPSEIT